MKSAILFFGLFGAAFGYTGTSPTLTSDGTRSDVVAAIAAAVDGDTVVIPAGTFSWTSGITISGKGIKLQGAGSGRVVARSNTSVTVGTGTKTFTLQEEEVASIEALKSALTGGTTLKVARTGGEIVGGVPNGNLPWMVGTITSYNAGTRELVMNITSFNHSGTHTVWNFSTEAATTIVDAAGDNTILVAITEDTTHSVEVSGIRFQHAAIYTSGWVLGKTTIDMGYASSGQPILVHDCYFEHTEYGFPFLAHTNRGVIWDCSLVNVIYVANNQGIKYTNNSTAAASWSSASTMGMADTTGKNNLYVEDSTLVAWQTGTDIDNGGRVVLRNCLMNHSGALTHGADSSNFGQRHFEIYDNQFVRENYANATTINVTKWFLIRGGTGLFARNTTSDFGGSDYPSSYVGDLAMWNLQLTTEGPNPHWGKDIVGVQYHCPRQIGFGYVTGAGVDGLGRSPNDDWAYVGDSEPYYIWGNTNNTPAIAPYGAQQSGEDNIADYVQAGRDFFADGTVKPGWTSYTYPHPLRTDIGPTFHSASTVVGANPSTSPRTDSITIGALTQGYIVAWYTFYDVDNITGVTFDGTAMGLIGSSGSSSIGSDCRMYGLYVGAKSAGTYNVVATLSGTGLDVCSGGVISYEGVGLAGTAAEANSTGTTATVNVTSASGELVIGCLYQDVGSTITPGAGQTERHEILHNTVGAAFSDEAGSSTTTHSYTWTGSCPWRILAVPLKAFRLPTTINAASVSRADVGAAVDSSIDGDIVAIPAGTGSDWTTTLYIEKAITLRGAGVGSTIIQDDIAAYDFPLISVGTIAGENYRITGIEFQPGARGTMHQAGLIQLAGHSQLVRVDHLKFGPVLNRGFQLFESVGGVADHCEFLYMLNCQPFLVRNGDPPGSLWGNGSWELPANFGSGNAWYIEDCTFTPDTNAYVGCVDSWTGGRYVFRKNLMTDKQGHLGNHGTETSQINRSGRVMEFYQNTFIKPASSPYDHLIEYRGGTGIVFGNILTAATGGWNYFCKFTGYRYLGSVDAPWGLGDGTWLWDAPNLTDGAGTPGGAGDGVFESGTATSAGLKTLTDTSKSWAPDVWFGYFIRQVKSITATSGGVGTATVTGAGWTTNEWTNYTITRISDNQKSLVASNTSDTLSLVAEGYYIPNFTGGGAMTMEKGGHVLSNTSTVITISDQPTEYDVTFTAGIPYEIRKPDFLIDQPGAGVSNPMSATSRPPHQNLGQGHTEPIYVWGNTQNSVQADATSDYGISVANRDFFNENDSFNGTSGVGIGTRAAMDAITPTVAKVGFWVTDEGEWDSTHSGADGRLYRKAAATNTWELFYTPYTYPHPLTTGDEPEPPASGSVTFGAGTGSVFSGTGSGSATFSN